MKLPAFQDLEIHGCAYISMIGIKWISEQATNLKSLKIFDRDMLVDSVKMTYSILELARGRNKVVIFS